MGAVFGSAQPGPWLGAMTLAVTGAGFLWGLRGSAGLALVSALLAGSLFLKGMPVGSLAGPWAAFGLCPLFLWAKECWFRAEVSRTQAHQKSIEERFLFLGKEREGRRLSIRNQEETIQGISDLYGLSKRFLATLDAEEAMNLTEEALAKWLPPSESSKRPLILQKIRSFMQSGTLSMEMLAQIFSWEGSDDATRERWAIVSGQLALGLRRVLLYHQVQESAIHDGLTGLLVRRYFRERLEEEVARSQRRSSSLAFLMIDLDHFKEINDTYGHLVGDVVLRDVAGLIRRSVREIDLVGRYGGEEFAVALPEADRALSAQIANRIRQVIETATIPAYDEQVRVTVSVGIALFPENAAAVGPLVDQADQAMYEAKKMGRNRTVAAP